MLMTVNAARVTAVAVAAYVLILLKQYGHDWLVGSNGELFAVDFIGVWAAGHLAGAGAPAAAYDPALHALAHTAGLGHASAEHYPFPYPPFHLALAAALATFAYVPAFATWVAVSLTAYLWAAAGIVGSPRGALYMAACPAVLTNVYIGQNGLWSAALLGFGLVELERRPILAGVFLGLLAYKPQIAMLVPVALIAGGCWRALAAAALTVAALVIASLAYHGLATWQAFAAQLGAVGGLIAQTNLDVGKLQTLYGALRALGMPPQAALAAQIAAAAAAVAATFVIWRRPSPFALKAAGLAAATLMVSPYLFVYDLAVLMVAQAFLIRYAQDAGYDEFDLRGIVAANIAVAAVAFTSQPFGLAATLILAVVVWRRMALGRPAGLSIPSPA